MKSCSKQGIDLQGLQELKALAISTCQCIELPGKLYILLLKLQAKQAAVHGSSQRTCSAETQMPAFLPKNDSRTSPLLTIPSRSMLSALSAPHIGIDPSGITFKENKDILMRAFGARYHALLAQK
ncbi:hypothetical protein MUCCIDRAFT_112736 [Mucor lusitanicus CBS 277.49]|uniref:Uncharacterized protein n=1 Tax=Mucor lusitanicus CBS 277.49 TaxID=747725 RepID=A0A168JK45_MUCCL|nr:hypothetical protein MUCCIDRAFT_112736 [Mucor lusitanicus CBS 277.49]